MLALRAGMMTLNRCGARFTHCPSSAFYWGFALCWFQAIHTWTMLQIMLTGSVHDRVLHMEAFAVPATGLMNFIIWFGFVKRGLAMVRRLYHTHTEYSEVNVGV